MAEEIKKISLANLTYYDEKLKAWITRSVANGAAVTIKTDETTAGYAKTYTIMQADALVGTIDIPKDMVVQSGTVEVDPEGQPKGTYIVLTLANATEDKLYVNVGSLVDIYTAKQSATQVQLAINSSTREISATLVNSAVDTQHIKDKAITIDKLSDAVKQLIEDTAKKVGGGAVYLEPTGSNGIWVATTDKIEAYENGQQIMLKCPESRRGSITININDLGAKNIYKNMSKGTISSITSSPMLFVYNSDVGGFVQLIDLNTTYSNATTTSNGLMSSSDKTKLDSLEKYEKATTEADGLMSKEDKAKIDGLVKATSSKDGLMSKEDKANLDSLVAGKGGYAVTAGTSTALTATVTGVTLSTGAKITLKLHDNIQSNATLNINNLGAKQIQSAGTNVAFVNKGTYDFVYDGTAWNIEGTHNLASASARGLMSTSDKETVDSIVPLLRDIETLLAEV